MNRVLGFKSRLVGGGVAIALLVGLAACGGPPKWVKQGSGAFNEKDTKGFYGVGAVAGVRNEPLAWDTAENRARAEIAKSFETFSSIETANGSDFICITQSSWYAGNFSSSTGIFWINLFARAISTAARATFSTCASVTVLLEENPQVPSTRTRTPNPESIDSSIPSTRSSRVVIV